VATPRQVVAVVDDDPGMLKGVARLLSAHGFGVETFSSAEAFLAGADASEATCLVLDIHLTGMSGIDLRRRLAGSGFMHPVIFMTAFDDEGRRREALETGCVAYLHKPFSANLLMEAICKSSR